MADSLDRADDSKTDSVASAANGWQTLIVDGSSNIAVISYHEQRQHLMVAFRGTIRSDKTYLYEGVSKEAWDKFTSAESKGSHFAREIKTRYTGRKL